MRYLMSKYEATIKDEVSMQTGKGIRSSEESDQETIEMGTCTVVGPSPTNFSCNHNYVRKSPCHCWLK